jgi:surface polysaccharide O-acyltransferase-like enzyme
MNKILSNKIYYVTFVLAVFVIVLHSSYVEQLNPELIGYDFGYVFQRIFLVIGEAAVPTFFVISGFLLFSKFTLKDYPRMLLKKLFSLVIPYLFWSLLAFVIMQVFYPLIKGETIEITFKSAIVDILLAKECPHLWFIRPLLVFFICSPLLYFVFKCLKKWSIFIPVILFFVYMFFRPEYGGILIWIPMFFIGSYLAYFNIPIMNKYRPRLISIIAMVVFISLAIVFAFMHTQYEDYSYYCYRFVSPILVWLSLDILTSLFEKESVRDIFKTSAFIFFTHLFVVSGVKELLQLGIALDSNYNCVLLFFLVFVISFIIDIGITYLLKKFFHPVYRFLGGR